MAFVFARIIHWIGELLILLIIARAFLSWFRPSYASRWYWDLVRLIEDLTEPIIAPIRRVMPDTGMFDFSPLVAILAIYVVMSVITSLLI